MIPVIIDAKNTTTMNPAANGIGAAVIARAPRPSPCRRAVMCNHAV
jgi:hypothetical protein